jgi:hypothetical protein
MPSPAMTRPSSAIDSRQSGVEPSDEAQYTATDLKDIVHHRDTEGNGEENRRREPQITQGNAD